MTTPEAAPEGSPGPRRWLGAAGWWLGGVALALALGVAANALLGQEAGRTVFRLALYSSLVAGFMFARGRTAARAAREGLSLGAAVTFLRWVLDRVW